MTVEIVFDPDHGKTQVRLDRIREEFRIRSQMWVEPVPGGGTMRGQLEVTLPRRHLHEFLNEVVEVPAVREIREAKAEVTWPPAT